MGADSGIVMVDGCFMVDRPCVNHAEKAVNHVLLVVPENMHLGRDADNSQFQTGIGGKKL